MHNFHWLYMKQHKIFLSCSVYPGAIMVTDLLWQWLMIMLYQRTLQIGLMIQNNYLCLGNDLWKFDLHRCICCEKTPRNAPNVLLVWPRRFQMQASIWLQKVTFLPLNNRISRVIPTEVACQYLPGCIHIFRLQVHIHCTWCVFKISVC